MIHILSNIYILRFHFCLCEVMENGILGILEILIFGKIKEKNLSG